MSEQTIDKMAFDIRAGRLSPYKIAFRIEELEAENEQLQQELKMLVNALTFYADPKSYFAIGFWPDRPCGDFINDFDAVVGIGESPGKRAREVLRKIANSPKGTEE